MKKSDKPDPLAMLLAMPLSQRIDAVAKDVQSRADVFRVIDAFDLAEALEVPQPESPSSSEWSITTYADRETIEEYIDRRGEPEQVLEWLEGTVGVRRLGTLKKAFAKLENAPRCSFAFLTAKERKFVEEIIEELSLEANEFNGMCCIGSYCVEQGEVQLSFEAEVEDDGSCHNLQTPYDERDGRFKDLSNCIEPVDW